MWIELGILSLLTVFQITTGQDKAIYDDLQEVGRADTDTTQATVDKSSPAKRGSPQAPPVADNWHQGNPPPGPWPPRGPPPAKSPDNGVPPGFETILPADIIQQLKNLHDNDSLSFPQKREEFDRILNTVSGKILSTLPFPPGFEALPADIKLKIKEIHTNPDLGWNDKSKQIGQIIEALPANQRQRLPGARPSIAGGRRHNFPPTPPPGFEKVLPKDVYDKLLAIHQDPVMTPKEKINKIDVIIRSLDQKILDNLPLPPGFDQLPAETVKKAKAIFSDKTLDYESKNKKIIQFVKSLPADQRLLVKPPMPPALSQLPEKVRDQIDAIFDNENLDEEQRHTEFWKLVDNLPSEQKEKIHLELGDGAGEKGTVGLPFGDEKDVATAATNEELPSLS